MQHAIIMYSTNEACITRTGNQQRTRTTKTKEACATSQSVQGVCTQILMRLYKCCLNSTCIYLTAASLPDVGRKAVRKTEMHYYDRASLHCNASNQQECVRCNHKRVDQSHSPSESSDLILTNCCPGAIAIGDCSYTSTNTYARM